MWTTCQMQARSVPGEILHPLTETVLDLDNPAGLAERLEQDGYIFLRGALAPADILAARHEVFSRLASVGELDDPFQNGIFSGTSQRRQLHEELGKFWQSVSEGHCLRHITHGARMQAIMDGCLGEPSHAHDYLFLRPAVPGRSTHLHYDHPFFARGSDRVHTAWIPLGDIPVTEGPLLIVENSHHFDDLIAQARSVDYDSNDTPLVQLMDDPAALARSRGVRLLTTDFQAGDLILFSMTLLHGSLDNISPHGRIRLSCDVRWQPAVDPVDPRYCGSSPAGTTGAGYAELNGAKPLNESWHQR